MVRWIEKIYEKNMDGWMDKKMEKKDGWLDRQKKMKKIDGWSDGQKKWMVGWIKNRWMVGWIEKMDGWMDG